MAKDRGQSLAMRLRGIIEAKKAERARVQAEAAVRQQWLRSERERLFKDLWAFAEAIGHLSVSGSDDFLLFSLDGRELRFDAEGRADRVSITGTGIPDHTEAFVQQDLELWVVSTPSGLGKTQQTLLFDQGLQDLMNTALALGE